MSQAGAETQSETTAVRRLPRLRMATYGLLVVVVIAIAAVVFLPRRNAANSRAAKDLSGAVQLALGEGRYEDARGILARRLQSDPRSAEAHYLLARVELATEHGQEAVNELARALDLGHPVEKLSPYHAVILARAGKLDEAEPALRTALANSDEPMPEIARQLARIYLDTFRLPKAAGPIGRWMKDAPNDPTPYMWQNEIETRSDADHAVIIQNYREALKRDPGLGKARLGLADRLRQAHRLEESSEEFREFLKAHPDDPEAHLGLGRVWLELGKTPDAAKEFDRVLELNPKDSIALKERGTIDLKTSKYGSARDFLRRAIAVDPFDPDSHYNLSLTLQRLGDAEGAKTHLALSKKLQAEHVRLAEVRSLLVKRPKDLPLRVEVARWMLEHGRDEEGIQWTDQILHDAPGHEPIVKLLIEYYAAKDPGKANYYRMMLKSG